MLMLDRDGTILAPERNTSFGGRIADAVVRLRAWSTRPHPPLQESGKAAQLGTLASPGTGSSSRRQILRSASE